MLTLEGDPEASVAARRRSMPTVAWLFPQLAPQEPPGRDAGAKTAYLRELAASLVETASERRDAELDHPAIPAGYAFFAQFVANELSSSPPASARARMGRVQGRAPRLDLAGVYGAGPSQAYLYDRTSKDGRLLIERPRGPAGEADLPRNGQGRALVGEPRNDRGLVIGQLHLAFLRFHNAVLEWVGDRAGLRGGEAFDEARRLVRWHFQWLVLHDLLPRLVGQEMVERLLARAEEAPAAGLAHYGAGPRPIAPLEFSLGAFLARYSLYRSHYDVNDDQRMCSSPRSVGAPASGNLRGERALPEGWSVQWDRFVGVDGSRPQACRRLNTLLAAWLHRGVGPPSAASGNRSVIGGALVRAWRAGLPSGQDVARALGLRPVRPGHDPLLAYVLTEAEDPPNDGAQLVGVGARIVAETLVGVVATDADSFLRREPRWRPTLMPSGREFDLAEMLRFAGAPLSASDLPTRAPEAPASSIVQKTRLSLLAARRLQAEHR